MMAKNFRIILFWGTAWGAFEATLGYIVHSIGLNIGWFFWFPMAFFFMNKVYKQTGSDATARWAILYISGIATAIKLSNLLFHTRIDMVIYPAVSIILEGFVVFLAFRILERKGRFFKLNYCETLALSISWRILFVIFTFMLSPYMVGFTPVSGMAALLEVVFLEGVINSIVVYFYISVFDKKYDEVKANSIIFDPFVSGALLVTAVFLQIGC